jgi:hypothetical protein
VCVCARGLVRVRAFWRVCACVWRRTRNVTLITLMYRPDWPRLMPRSFRSVCKPSVISVISVISIIIVIKVICVISIIIVIRVIRLIGLLELFE